MVDPEKSRRVTDALRWMQMNITAVLQKAVDG